MLQFVERHRLMGQGLGWIDLHLLASALVSHATLSTRDGRLARAAHVLGWRHDYELIDVRLSTSISMISDTRRRQEDPLH